MQVDLKKLSLSEKKALAYDELSKIQQAQNNLNILNESIANHKEPAPIREETKASVKKAK